MDGWRKERKKEGMNKITNEGIKGTKEGTKERMNELNFLSSHLLKTK